MSTKVKLKKSSIVGRVPSVNDLDYGEIAINYADGRIYYKSSSNSINYFQDFNNALAGFDSADVFGIIDSAYIQNRQNLEYSSLIGIPTSFTPNGVDSSATFALIDSDYIATRANLAFAGTADITNYQFVADSGDITFTGTDANGLTLSFNNQLVQVYLNGILLLENDDYTKSNNNTIILSSPADSGDQLIVSDFNAFFTNQTVTANTIHGFIDSALASVGEADITAFEFTADSGQTAFSGIDNNGATLSLDPTGVQVYLNGILLSGASDYTVSANTLTLTDGASLNSHLSVQSFKRYFNFVGLDSADITGIVDATYIQANQTAQDFAYASLTGVPTTFAPIGVDSASTIALIDSAYIAARTPEVVATDLSDYRTETQIKALIDSGVNAVIDAAPGALDTLNELAAALGDDANFSTTITNQIATKIDSAGVVGIVDAAYVQSRQTPQDFAYTSLTSTPTTIAGYGITDAFDGVYSSLTGAPNVLDSADVLAIVPAQTPQDFAYASLTGAPNVLDSAAVATIAGASVGTDSAAIEAMIDSNYVASRVTLAYAGNAEVKNYKFVADSAQTVFTGADENAVTLGFTNQLVQVYLNGVLLLDSDDYTKSNNNTITLVTPANLGDQLIVSDFKSFFASAGLDSADITNVIDATYIQANQTPQDFTYSSLTGAPNVLDSAEVISLIDSAYVSARAPEGYTNADVISLVDSAYITARQSAQDFAYSSLTGAPNVLDSANVSTLITTAVDALVDGAPGALDTLNELATALNDDSNAIAAINNTLALKLNIADVVPQDFAYSSLTGVPTTFAPTGVDSGSTLSLINAAYIQANQTPQDFTYSSLTGAPNVLDSADVTAIATAAGGVDSAAIEAMIDSNYVASRVSLAYAGNASVQNYKFIADSGQTAFTGLSYSDQFVQVYLNGVLLLDSDDYTKSGNDTITLITGAASGDQLIVSDFTSFFTNQTVDSAQINSLIDSALDNVGRATVTNYKFIADSAQTTFTGTDANGLSLSYSNQLVQVYLNGVLLLDSDDYTKSGNNTITLATAIDSGDQLIIADYKSFFTSSGFDSAGILSFIDQDYIRNNQTTYASLSEFNNDTKFLDSNTVTDVIDAAYIQANQTAQDFAYSSLTGTPNILDSADVLSLSLDAAEVTSLVDSAYVQARQISGGNVSQFTNDAGYTDFDSNNLAGALKTFSANRIQLSANNSYFGVGTSTGSAGMAIKNNSGQPFHYGQKYLPADNGQTDLELEANPGGKINVNGFRIYNVGTPTDNTDAATKLYVDNNTFSGNYNDLTNQPTIFSGSYTDLTNKPTLFDGAYSSLTGTPNVLDSADVTAIATAAGGVDSAAIEAMIDSNYVASRVTLAYAGNAEVKNYKFIADSNQTIFTGADENAVTLGFTNQLVQVYLNGVLLLDGDDYTKSNNNTITLTQSASVGDQLIVSDFKSFFASAGLDSADITNVIDATYIQANQTAQNFAYSSLTGAPNVLDSNNVSALITTSIDNLIDGAPGALDTLNELATALNDDSNAIAAINNTLALKLNIADVTPQDFSYASLTGVPTTFAPTGVDSGSTLSLINAAYIQANQTPQDFAYASLTGAPNVLDSADVLTIANAAGGVDSAAIEAMIDSNYVASRVTLAYAGNAQVQNTKFIADSAQTVFTGLSYADQLVQVYLNGVLLLDSDDYTKSGNDTITLTQPVNLGDQLIVSDFNAFFTNQTVDSAQINSLIDSALGTVGRATVKNYKFIADSGDITFTGTDANGLSLSYNSQLVQVYLNGLLLTESTDYTKSGNDTITLISAADSGDELSIVDFNSFFTYSGFDSADVLALQTPQDFAYSSLTGAPNVLDSADVLALAPAQDFAYSSLTGTPNILDSADVLALAPAQDFAYSSLTGTPNILDSANVLALQTPQDFAYASLTGTPNILDSANVLAIVPAQDFAYASLTGTPNVLDSANVSTLITTAVDALVDGAPGALNTLNELAIALNDDSNAIAAINNTLTLKLNIADVTPQDFAYSSLTGAPNVLDSADVLALAPAQDFAYSSLTGAPNVLDSGDVLAIAAAIGGVDSAAIEAMIDSNYVASRVSLAYAGNAQVQNTKFIADSAQTVFTGLSYADQFVQVYLNGVLLLDSDDYVKSGNDTITLITGAASGDQLIVSDFKAFFTNQTVDSAQINSLIDSALDNVGRATVKNYKFVADSGDTIFTGTDANGLSLSYNNQLVQVYLNGLLLTESTDYTKTGSDTITLVGGADSGDELSIVDFNSFFTYNGFDSAGITSIINASYIQANQTAQDFAYSSLTGAPNVLDSADVLALAPAQDFAYSSLTGAPNVLDSADVLALAPGVDSASVLSIASAPRVYTSSTTHTVTVASKTSGNKYFNVGSSNAFFIDGIETPYIQLTPGQTYVFDQADTSNNGHPLRFYYDEDKATEYSSGVTVTGTAGNAGANTTIAVDDDTPARLYYLCQFHSNMGWAIGTDTHNTTGLDTDGLTEGSTNQYFTTARARAAISGGTGVTLSSGQISIGQPVGTSDNVTFSNITATGSLSVTGTNAFLSTSNLQVNDNIITLNADETGTPSDNVGFEVERGTASNVSLIWAEDSDQWQITTDGSNFYKILTTNDNITADDVALLNGESASYYLNYINFTNKPTSITDFSISDGTAGQVLTTDGSGNFSFTTVSGSGGGGVNGNNIVTEHKLTSSGTAAYLTAAGSYSTVQVFVNGVLARDSDDYVFNDSNGYVTFASAPPSGSEIMIFGHKTSTLDIDSDNNLSLTAGLNVGNHSSYTSSTSTNSTSNEATIDTFDGASVRGAKYVITAEDQSGNYQISEALVVHDGTTATITTYGTINTGSGNIAIFDAEYSGGNVLIKATPTTSNTTYKIVRTDVVI